MCNLQEEAQPMYTNYPFGVCLAHNGNLTNIRELKESVFAEARHINTDSVNIPALIWVAYPRHMSESSTAQKVLVGMLHLLLRWLSRQVQFWGCCCCWIRYLLDLLYNLRIFSRRGGLFAYVMTCQDSELLINVFAKELTAHNKRVRTSSQNCETIISSQTRPVFRVPSCSSLEYRHRPALSYSDWWCILLWTISPYRAVREIAARQGTLLSLGHTRSLREQGVPSLPFLSGSGFATRLCTHVTALLSLPF